MVRLDEHARDSDSTVERCQAGTEARPALGCPRRIDVLQATFAFPPGDHLDVEAILPTSLRSGLVVLEASLETSEVEGWKAVPPIMLEGQRAVALQLPLPPDLERANEIRVRIVGQTISDQSEAFQTREIPIGPRSSLRVGLAIDPVAADVGAGPAEFVVRAHTGSNAVELLREIVEPETTRGHWLDRHVSLDAFAGQRVAFEFHATALDLQSHSMRPSFTVPIWGSPQIVEARSREGRRNVVVVSLDTLRDDFVGSEREGHRLTPALDARAEEGTRFTQALAPYPSTSASHMSLFTSRYPAEHRVTHPKDTLAASVPTLAEIFAENGYETAAFTENGMLAAASGFERGFDQYDENRGISMWDARGDIETTLDRGLRWLRRHRHDQFFLFLHTYEVHTPYQPPRAFDRFRAPPAGNEKPGWARRRNRYAGEVVYTDHVLRRLFRTLERLGLADDTVVVITADHGEEFGEHGQMGHAKTVYDEVLRVPLVFWGPGLIPDDIERRDLVSLIDIGPTLLDLQGLPIPAALRGESLRPALLDGAPPESRVRFAEGPAKEHEDGRLFAARTATHKWITREKNANPTEIYDLRTDPSEQDNLASDPELRRRGSELLRQYREIDARYATGDDEDRDVDHETQQKLRALGYLD